MKLEDLITTAADTITVKRVFGEPYERDGVVIIPAATVAGGVGGGGGQDQNGQSGEGGGMGMGARPAGAYVVKEGRVSWRPAVDVNRLIATVGLVAIVYLTTRARIQKTRAKADAWKNAMADGRRSAKADARRSAKADARRSAKADARRK